MISSPSLSTFFFFNDTATTEIYTLSLHDALPICSVPDVLFWIRFVSICPTPPGLLCKSASGSGERSEEHTSELQSHLNLVCRLLLEKKKKNEQHDRQRRGDIGMSVKSSLLRRSMQ